MLTAYCAFFLQEFLVKFCFDWPCVWSNPCQREVHEEAQGGNTHSKTDELLNLVFHHTHIVYDTNGN